MRRIWRRRWWWGSFSKCGRLDCSKDAILTANPPTNRHACYLSSFGHDTRTVLQCLQVLDAALCYTVFPTETLTICIVALCRTVTEQYCQTSWRIMKNLLGTNLGHVTLLTMCNILSDREMYADETLLRGAVFHINMGLWGQSGSVVPMLRCSPATVLASFRNVSENTALHEAFK